MQGLEQVIATARLALGRGDPVRFVLAGGGSQSASIRAAAKDLPNVSFLGVLPDGVYASVLRAADILLLSERPTEVDASLPSKLTSYFAAGRPIVAAIPPQGASAREIGRSGAGLIVPAGEPAQLLDALARVRGDSALASQLAAAGPAFAEERTSAKACLHRAAAFVEAIAGHPRTPFTGHSWSKA
jgi:glycosyltransferase involved in cell wall biosynthesis